VYCYYWCCVPFSLKWQSPGVTDVSQLSQNQNDTGWYKCSSLPKMILHSVHSIPKFSFLLFWSDGLYTAFIWRSIRAGFYTSDSDYDFQELCNEADHQLFNMILQSQYHVLEQLLPPVLRQSYNLRKRPHSRQIPNRCSYLTDCNFLTRMLFADSYWWCFFFSFMFVLSMYNFNF